MTQANPASTPLPSPCMGTCTIDPKSDLCIGCLRTRDEIALWRASDNEMRQQILDNIIERRKQRTG